MSRYLNDNYKKLEEYVPGEQPKDMKYIKLNTNESPFAPSAGVLEAINADSAKLLKLYPDPDAAELRERVGGLFGYGKENVFVSNGSDEVLNFEVSGDKIQAVHMLPGYTHNIINLSETENLVTLMWANESFDPNKPDTFFEVVE